MPDRPSTIWETLFCAALRSHKVLRIHQATIKRLHIALESFFSTKISRQLSRVFIAKASSRLNHKEMFCRVNDKNLNYTQPGNAIRPEAKSGKIRTDEFLPALRNITFGSANIFSHTWGDLTFLCIDRLVIFHGRQTRMLFSRLVHATINTSEILCEKKSTFDSQICQRMTITICGHLFDTQTSDISRSLEVPHTIRRISFVTTFYYRRSGE